MKIIKVSDHFPYPGPRYERIGPQSGEAFRKFLIKKLKEFYGDDYSHNNNLQTTIDLDGTIGFGSSFLEEGFGGLLRHGVPYRIVQLIKIKTLEEPELEDEVWEYINDEHKNQNNQG
ncbi:STAS-like domain-containing protein [Cronobacter sakazakii]|uniref:STAS-like domain-containing protein n=1 Tax=Cronobacter TaxID=413496 RepID=UPI001C0CDF37|nr:STAS-like domain-containing protein [Cronobacter sakazakii]EIV2971721.1 STAS-like domain-containing protein [Cronobacter sakazakii]EKK4013459.1 STAS-like domain-containing protein [Cronobacter sakazakii]EKY1998861.1 STAS-like domain-containing protein [Cronobacter sakazakii]ELQ6167623.1 STAS-like domain-containing protein [Cronobacter sakazakii]ELQ6180372.1 STAS-like domain-containing protein [Cronobacter sakazakii]